MKQDQSQAFLDIICFMLVGAFTVGIVKSVVGGNPSTFIFRGLEFRISPEGDRLQVFSLHDKEWQNTGIIDRQELEAHYREYIADSIRTIDLVRGGPLDTIYFKQVEPIPQRYGPWRGAPPEMHELWEEVLKEIKEKYPLTHPALLSEARLAKTTPEEIQLGFVHERWLEERRKLIDEWRQKYKEEDDEYQEEDDEEE